MRIEGPVSEESNGKHYGCPETTSLVDAKGNSISAEQVNALLSLRDAAKLLYAHLEKEKIASNKFDEAVIAALKNCE